MGPTDGLPPKFHYRWLESKFTEVMENFCINFGSSYKFLLKKKNNNNPALLILYLPSSVCCVIYE